ncbi:DUF6154 family protein [Alteribacillus iranensis]|uniref:Uncharacterized protein n=1 Tax=Alteribacillus iranensis TaxID=930128 RepID=A0A1I2DN90_9BACI|nr:DUF6154 family protein [Alteribacillus iranensis]SFE82092.1 hypothetical protein SAMN05192532_104191 [Alteribacillus iranensis]
MEFIDNLYELYKNKLTGDEEDALVVIEGILESFSNKDIEKLFSELSEKERYEMMALFLYEQFRLKLAQEGVGQTRTRNDEKLKYYH